MGPEKAETRRRIIRDAMTTPNEELGKALQTIAEQSNEIHESISRLGAGLTAVKATLAIAMDPANPKQASDQIQKLEETFSKLDPNAAARKRLSEAIEMLKMIDKHGGPKQA
jgi:hypothetical protein